MKRCLRPLELLGASVAALCLSLLTYLPHVLRGGWYYDDWHLIARMRLAPSQSLPSLWNAITVGPEPAQVYRPGQAAVTVLFYKLCGTTPWHYLLLGVLLAAVGGLLSFMVVRLAGYPLTLAVGAGALYVVLPMIDATRLWTTGLHISVAMCLLLGGFALTLANLDRSHELWWHAAGAVMLLLAVITYEATFPLVLLGALLYTRRTSLRAASKRWALDAGAGLAGLLIVRSQAHGVNSATFRPSHLVSRAKDVSSTTRLTLRLAMPGPTPLKVMIALIVVPSCIAAVVRWRDPTIRSYALLAAGGAVAAGAGLLMYLPLAGGYLPRPTGLEDRVNAPAAPGAILATVALAMICGLSIAVAFRRPRLANAISAVMLAGLVVVFGARELKQQTTWQRSWTQQTHVLDIAQATLPQNLPQGSRIVTFEHTRTLRGDVPVFRSKWDLDGALRFRYRMLSLQAHPWDDKIACRSDGVTFSDTTKLPYDHLWFVFVASRTAMAVSNVDDCNHLLRVAPAERR